MRKTQANQGRRGAQDIHLLFGRGMCGINVWWCSWKSTWDVAVEGWGVRPLSTAREVVSSICALPTDLDMDFFFFFGGGWSLLRARALWCFMYDMHVLWFGPLGPEHRDVNDKQGYHVLNWDGHPEHGGWFAVPDVDQVLWRQNQRLPFGGWWFGRWFRWPIFFENLASMFRVLSSANLISDQSPHHFDAEAKAFFFSVGECFQLNWSPKTPGRGTAKAFLMTSWCQMILSRVRWKRIRWAPREVKPIGKAQVLIKFLFFSSCLAAVRFSNMPQYYIALCVGS